MFAGTGGLSDYNLPEDVSFRGVDFLRTPSPAMLAKSQSPGSGVKSLAPAAAGTAGSFDQVGTPDAKVGRPAVQLSSSPAPAWRLGTLPGWLGPAPAAGWLGAAPAAALAPPQLADDISSSEAVQEEAWVPAKGRGQRSGHAGNSSQAPTEKAPAEVAVEVQPKKRGRRSRPATSQPATVEEPDEEPAEEAEAEVQPKRRARVKSRLSSSSPATADQAEAEGVEEQPRKRARRSGPSTSKPAVTAAGAVAAPDAAAEDEPVAPDAAAEEEAVAPEAEAAEVDGGEVDGSAAGEEDFSQLVDWDAVRKLKTFAGRYLPKTRDGAGTWVTRRTLFFTLVPLEYQTTRLQLSFWKYLSEKTGAGVSEADAAHQFVQEGTAAGAASAAD